MANITKHASLGEAVNYAAQSNWMASRWIFEGSTDNVTNAVQRWRNGPSAAQVKRVSDLMGKIDSSFRDRQREQWEPSPFGAYPVVPDYLAGDPFSMRAKNKVESDATPITFWVELGLSANISDDHAEIRAAAIAALITRTSEDRPVEVKIICASKLDNAHKFVQIDLDMKTFDASYIARSMVMYEIIRPIRWALITDGAACRGSIGWAFSNRPDASREARIRQTFGVQPQDVVIQAAIGYSDVLASMVRDPVKWVHKQIEKQRSMDNE